MISLSVRLQTRLKISLSPLHFMTMNPKFILVSEIIKRFTIHKGGKLVWPQFKPSQEGIRTSSFPPLWMLNLLIILLKVITLGTLYQRTMKTFLNHHLTRVAKFWAFQTPRQFNFLLQYWRESLSFWTFRRHCRILYLKQKAFFKH